jgi:hypothetical protein
MVRLNFLTITAVSLHREVCMSEERMDQIIDVLEREQQRATYGAVAALLGKAPRTLMMGRQRDARHSWVVSRKSGTPTGYDPTLMHPALLTHDHIIETREELERWLANVGELAATG